MVAEQRVNTIVVCFEDRRSVLPVEQLLDMKLMGIDVLDGHQLFEEVSGRSPVESLRPSAVIFSPGFKQRRPPMSSSGAWISWFQSSVC